MNKGTQNPVIHAKASGLGRTSRKIYSRIGLNNHTEVPETVRYKVLATPRVRAYGEVWVKVRPKG